MNAYAVVDAARSLLGVPWRHRGRKPWALDCVGLVKLAFDRAGVTVDDAPRLYGREPWNDTLRAGCVARWGEPVTGTPEVGDVVLMRWDEGDPTHIAIVGDHPDGGRTVIHCHNIHGVIETSIDAVVSRRIVATFRPRFE